MIEVWVLHSIKLAPDLTKNSPLQENMKKLSIYSVTELDNSPTLLSRRDGGVFYQHLPIPLPEQIVLFSLGPWMGSSQTAEVTVAYKEDCITLGTLTSSSRCLCWERATLEVPKCMLSEKENGVAKLLVEITKDSSSCDEDITKPVLTNLQDLDDMKTWNENTPQLDLSDSTSTPDKPTKQKRRASKGEKTPTGPSSKKQKTQQQKSNTRLRNLKSGEKTDPMQSKSPVVNDKENTDSSNIPEVKQKVQKKEKSGLLGTKKENAVLSSPQSVAVCKDVTCRAVHPSSRWGHSLCFVHKNLSVLIGGQGDKQQLSKDSVWSLDAETRKWKCPDLQSEGQKPEYRMGHTATYDPMVRCVYVYGGSKNTRWFHDVHMLDVDSWKWQLVKVSGKAPTRAYHSATLYRHELWIFGGVYPRPDPQPDGCSNEIHIFSPVMESWYSPIVKGEKPIPRSGHSATLISDQLVVFGGWDAPISYSDLHILDLSIVEWSQPEVKGTPPAPRSWHASCSLTGNRIMIHGGYDGNLALDDTHIFSLDDLCWTQITVDPMPLARAGHSALCLPYRCDNQHEDEVLIFGGGDNDGAFFDDLLSVSIPIKAGSKNC